MYVCIHIYIFHTYSPPLFLPSSPWFLIPIFPPAVFPKKYARLRSIAIADWPVLGRSFVRYTLKTLGFSFVPPCIKAGISVESSW